MSHHAVQRVVVRMLYDAEFAAAVYAAPGEALAGLALTSPEREWLTRPDPRAWRTDPYRRSRTLTALIAEAPVTVALALRRGASAADLDRFFSSPWFHQAIEGRRALAPRFGAFLEALGERLGERAVSDQARMETAVARVRRHERPAPSPGAELTLGVAKALARVDPGGLEWWQAAHGALSLRGAGGDLVAAALDTTSPLPPPPAAAPGFEYVLAERGEDGAPVMSELPEALGRLLELVQRGTTRAALHRLAAEFGADAAEADEIVDDLVRDGLLERAPA